MSSIFPLLVMDQTNTTQNVSELQHDVQALERERESAVAERNAVGKLASDVLRCESVTFRIIAYKYSLLL